jgi:hypothetical protein
MQCASDCTSAVHLASAITASDWRESRGSSFRLYFIMAQEELHRPEPPGPNDVTMHLPHVKLITRRIVLEVPDNSKDVASAMAVFSSQPNSQH